MGSGRCGAGSGACPGKSGEPRAGARGRVTGFGTGRGAPEEGATRRAQGQGRPPAILGTGEGTSLGHADAHGSRPRSGLLGLFFCSGDLLSHRDQAQPQRPQRPAQCRSGCGVLRERPGPLHQLTWGTPKPVGQELSCPGVPAPKALASLRSSSPCDTHWIRHLGGGPGLRPDQGCHRLSGSPHPGSDGGQGGRWLRAHVLSRSCCRDGCLCVSEDACRDGEGHGEKGRAAPCWLLAPGLASAGPTESRWMGGAWGMAAARASVGGWTVRTPGHTAGSPGHPAGFAHLRLCRSLLYVMFRVLRHSRAETRLVPSEPLPSVTGSPWKSASGSNRRLEWAFTNRHTSFLRLRVSTERCVFQTGKQAQGGRALARGHAPCRQGWSASVLG
ncbi:uncharacterized protein LOC116573891 [Mustela erminea]|uniref:uncharacterized protein LOC116573891 n=1 Tax=Mustela erminea TaxID=36723 RepID=UPI00138681F2|nr:uncharacterized protein LOC116573891 [Mustela erminea]